MRCCLRPPLVAAACLIATSLHSASADRVLVVGADATLLHDATTASSTPPALAARFSPAGLAQLAMDALGLPTGSLVRLASDASVDAKDQLLVQSPVQADVFARVDAYAMVFLDSADADVLTTVDAAATSGYHKIFDLTPDAAAGPSTKIPGVIASALKDSVGARVECAGSALVCTSEALPAVDPTRAQLEQVYARYGFLDRTKAADVALATELAQTQQLTAGIASDSATAPNALFAVNFGGVAALSGKTKQTDARHAIATEVQALLRALQQKYPTSSGAQVVATSRSAATTNVAVSPTAVESLVAYSRMLLSFNEKIGSASLDEDDDDDDLSAVNGTTSDITIEDIAEYQIVLWTSVILGAVLLLVIIAMCNMNNKRDSLLYAKFTTSNGGRKYD